MKYRIPLALLLSSCCSMLFLTDCVAQSNFSNHNRQTPFEFVQRPDVVQEVGVSNAQLARVTQLVPNCNALCQQKFAETINLMNREMGQELRRMSAEDREQLSARVEQQTREEVEIEVLDDQVLNSKQMDRFNEIWVQNLGFDALTSGATSRRMGISDDQFVQIAQIQNGGSAAIDACVADPSLSSGQRSAKIRSIQNNIINQTVNVLNIQQVNIYLNLHGSPFDRNPDYDKPDEGEGGETENPDNGDGSEGSGNEPGGQPVAGNQGGRRGQDSGRNPDNSGRRNGNANGNNQNGSSNQGGQRGANQGSRRGTNRGGGANSRSGRTSRDSGQQSSRAGSRNARSSRSGARSRGSNRGASSNRNSSRSPSGSRQQSGG